MRTFLISNLLIIIICRPYMLNIQRTFTYTTKPCPKYNDTTYNTISSKQETIIFVESLFLIIIQVIIDLHLTPIDVFFLSRCSNTILSFFSPLFLLLLLLLWNVYLTSFWSESSKYHKFNWAWNIYRRQMLNVDGLQIRNADVSMWDSFYCHFYHKSCFWHIDMMIHNLHICVVIIILCGPTHIIV